MMSFNQIMRWSWAFLVAVTLVLGLGGCEGDDGAPGAAGAAGAPGADGTDGTDGTAGLACWDLNGNGVEDPAEDTNGDGVFDTADCAAASAKVTPLESCGVCHSEGSFADASAAHALDPIEFVDNVVIALVAGTDDLAVSFDLTVDGAPGVGYDSLERGYRQNGTDSAIVLDNFSALTDNGDGSYSFTITDGNLAAGNNRYLFRVSKGGDRETRVYAWGDFPATAFATPAVSADACGACHGPEGIGIHGGYYTAADVAEPCLVCHGGPAPWSGQPVPSLAAVAHGLHSGIWEEDGEVVEVTYPTYMTNCSVCHSEEAQLTAANAMSVSGENCFTCHGSMASWEFAGSLAFHTGYDETTNCQLCHASPADEGFAPWTVAQFHNGATTGRGGIIWDGVDTSVAEGAKFDWAITGMVDDGTNLTFTWQASYNGVGVDPCNDAVGVGAPTFHLGDGGLRTYRSYAQGDDFIIGTSTSAPGQPDPRVNPTADNTTCAGNVATTVIPAADVDAEKGRIALGGKPLVVSPDATGLVVAARVPSPTYDWLVGDGAPMERRAVVDSEKCVGCHVGSLYQHGGDRVDNVDYCLVCHNSASNEQNVRAGMGVDASEAYDGKVGETFEMKTMLHRVHSAGVDGQPPYVIYRNRGIYAFAPDVSLVPNWDVVTTEGCTDDEIAAGRRRVFGSDPESPNRCEAHNFEAPTYPRSLNECTACHTEDFMVIPDQTKAMATTTEAGSQVWDNQHDDVLQGAGTTACITCHADSASKGHAYQNSWTPQVFPEGRQTIIDAVN